LNPVISDINQTYGFSLQNQNLIIEDEHIYNFQNNNKEKKKIIIGYVKNNKIININCKNNCNENNNNLCKNCLILKKKLEKRINDHLEDINDKKKIKLIMEQKNLYNITPNYLKLIQKNYDLMISEKPYVIDDFIKKYLELKKQNFEKSFLFRFIFSIFKNFNKKNGKRYSEELLLFYKYLNLIGGKKCCEFISKNLVGPNLSTIKNLKYETSENDINEIKIISSSEIDSIIHLMKSKNEFKLILAYDKIELNDIIDEIGGKLYNSKNIKNYRDLLEQNDVEIFNEVCEVIATFMNGSHCFNFCSIPCSKKMGFKSFFETFSKIIIKIENKFNDRMKILYPSESNTVSCDVIISDCGDQSDKFPDVKKN
jgi:hypothetical protein